MNRSEGIPASEPAFGPRAENESRAVPTPLEAFGPRADFQPTEVPYAPAVEEASDAEREALVERRLEDLEEMQSTVDAVHDILFDGEQNGDNRLERMERMLNDFEERMNKRFADIEAMITLLANGDIPADKNVDGESAAAPAEVASPSAPEASEDTDNDVTPNKSAHTTVAIAPPPAAQWTVTELDENLTGLGEEEPAPKNETQPEQTAEVDGDTRDLDRYMQRFDAHHHDDEQPAEGGDPERAVEKSLQEQLEEATDRYAELSAKKRGSHVGRFLRTSRVLVKIPGVRALAERVNGKVDEELDQAKTEYESLVTQSQDEVAVALYEKMDAENPDMTAEEMGRAIYLNASMVAVEADSKLEDKVLTERLRQSKPTNKFVNWWMRQKGLGGRMKKYLTVSGVGVGVGGAAAGVGLLAGAGALLGGFALPGVGALAGGAAGLAIGRHVAKRRAQSVDADGLTLAGRQSAQDRDAKESASFQQYEIDNPEYDPENEASGEEFIDNPDIDILSAATLNEITEKRTAEEQAENRRTTVAATLAGAAGGKIAGAGVAAAANGIGSLFGASGAASTPVTGTPSASITDTVREAITGATPDADPTAAPLPEVETYDLVTGAEGDPTVTNIEQTVSGSEIFVEDGNGLIEEIQQYAAANGVEIDTAQAEGVCETLRSQLASTNDILTTGTYQMADGGIGITSPGVTSWTPNAYALINNSLNIVK